MWSAVIMLIKSLYLYVALSKNGLAGTYFGLDLVLGPDLRYKTRKNGEDRFWKGSCPWPAARASHWLTRWGLHHRG